MNWIRITFIVVFCLLYFGLYGQVPFDCNGRIYRVIEQAGGTSFQELTIDPESQKLETLDLQFYDNHKINGIAYHPTQNLIYGVLLGKTYRLCRIDGNHQLDIIRELPLPEHLLFVSGDVSPDERFLVLLGYNPDETSNVAALVDLTDPAFPTRIIELSTTTPEYKKVFCADIAFHPTTDELFGFDELSKRLVTIDLASRTIDNAHYPATDVLHGNVPSMFFDAEGELFGIGTPHSGYNPQRNLYHFNVDNGQVKRWHELQHESNQDACSCPFQVKLLNRVSTRTAAGCTELEFQFTLINRSGRIQQDLVFSDTFPSYMEIQHISALPFSGRALNGTGSNIIHIRDITLPVGESVFSLTLTINRDAPHTTVYNTAYLDGIVLNSPDEQIRIPSDDPETVQAQDPTFFAIRPLQVEFFQSEVFMCPDSSVVLQPNGLTGAEYHWNTGERSSSITAKAPGWYQLTLTTACEKAVGNIQVSLSRLQIELGTEKNLERGEPLEIQPEIQSSSAVRSYHWSVSGTAPMACDHCPSLSIIPQSDVGVQLAVENEDGCTAVDELQIKLTDFGLFAPNAFSPNGDQVNDIFYLQSRRAYTVQNFHVFDRWGSMVFQAPEGGTNEAQVGWDGFSRGKMMRAGIYIWTAEVINGAGHPVRVSGEVNLIR